MKILFTFFSILLLIVLIVGFINPSLVLRWSKKPTKLKVFGYWFLSFIALFITTAMIEAISKSSNNAILTQSKSTPQENTETEFNYGIITQKTGSKVMIDAYYDAEIYKKDNIAEVLQLITQTAKEKNPNKKIDIFLYPSERIGKINRTQWIAISGYGYTNPNLDIDYDEEKINALNTRYTDTKFLELEKFLNDRNTSTYNIYAEIQKIAKNALSEANEKYDFNSDKHGEFQEKRELEEIAKLFSKYNIPDSLDYKISAYSIYCK